MASWSWLPLTLVAAALLGLIAWMMLRPAPGTALVEYPDGVTLAGPVRGDRAAFVLVQWLSAPGKPAPCPLVVHLPGGDLGGDALCDLGSPQAAAELGAPVDLDVFPFHDGRGGAAGIRVGVLPGCPVVEVSVGGIRLALPLSEEDATRLLGKPLRRAVYDPSARPQ